MKINFITQKFNTYNNTINTYNSYQSKPMNIGLQQDTVSFTAKKKDENSIFLDAFNKNYDDNITRRRAIANKLMVTVNAVAEQVDGLEFDKKYYEKSVLKSKKSFISKLRRSGAAPLDQIRTTVYIKDIYNFTILNNFLKKMSENGFEIMMIPDVMNGKKIVSRKPDFDIRLDNVPEQELKKLPEALRTCVSNKLPSGLSDIQIRFIDTTSKDEDPIEVIIMVGKESGKAKQVEEDDVYNYLRVLKNELNITRVKVFDAHSPVKKYQDNLSVFSSLMRNFISRPMYTNARALDVDNVKLGLPVAIPQENAPLLKGLLNGITTSTTSYYNGEIKKLRSDDFTNKKELEKSFRATTEYKSREDKTVYIEDLRKHRATLIKDLKRQKEEDLEQLSEITAGLQETIDKYTLK